MESQTIPSFYGVPTDTALKSRFAPPFGEGEGTEAAAVANVRRIVPLLERALREAEEATARAEWVPPVHVERSLGYAYAAASVAERWVADLADHPALGGLTFEAPPQTEVERALYGLRPRPAQGHLHDALVVTYCLVASLLPLFGSGEAMDRHARWADIVGDLVDHWSGALAPPPAGGGA